MVLKKALERNDRADALHDQVTAGAAAVPLGSTISADYEKPVEAARLTDRNCVFSGLARPETRPANIVGDNT
jgi:hypothetical protein